MRRPDIRIAERQLAAATARIGIAVGDLFPRVSFIGSVGYNAGTTSDLGNAASQTYAYGPTLSWAALDLGRVRSRIGIANAQADAALARRSVADGLLNGSWQKSLYQPAGTRRRQN